jgi:hypothetical protein
MLRNRVVIAAALTLAVASSAAAQTSTGTATPQTTQTTPSGSTTSSDDMQTRPATTTFMGDTGLWYVPTGEVLPRKKWSISAYRVNFDDNQGFSDISNWPLTFGYGVGDRAEIFGSWVLVNRIDRDIRPLFSRSCRSRRRRGAEPADADDVGGQTGRLLGRRQVQPDVEWRRGRRRSRSAP